MRRLFHNIIAYLIMRQYIISLLWAVQLAIGSSALHAESYTHTIRFSPEDLRIAEVGIDGSKYTEITMQGMESVGEPGAPAMPYTAFHVSVPPEATDFTITIIPKASPVIYALTWNPLPAQSPRPTSIEAQEETFMPLSSKYLQSNSTFPAKSAEVVGVSAIGGYNRVATVSVCPLLWTAAQNKIALMPEMEVTLNWKTDPKAATNLLYPCFTDIIEEADEQARQMVINPEAVGNYATTRNGLTKSQRAATTQERIPYVIVTTKELAPSLERLAALRRLRGFESRIVCIEDILADQRFKDGDLISGINDEAGKLRAFLSTIYVDWGTQYVLLAGQFNLIPGRWMTNSFRICESDAYYRNPTSQWIFDNSAQVYRQIDKSSLLPVLYMGRLPIELPSDVDNYIDKIIQYEYNVKDVDLSYMNNAYILYGTDSSINSSYQKYSYKFHNNNFSTVFIDNLNSDMYGTEVIQSMNSQKWGYMDWRCHGHFGGVGTYHYCTNCDDKDKKKDYYHGINALDAHKEWFEPEEKNGLDNYNNKDYPFWTISMSCQLGEYNITATGRNMAQSFLLGKDYGGVSFMGNSEAGWSYDSRLLIDSVFVEAVRCFHRKLDIPYAAKVGNAGMAKIIRTSATEAIKPFHIFGDPLVPVWVKEPKYFRCSENNLNMALSDSIVCGVYNISEHKVSMYSRRLLDIVSLSSTTNRTFVLHRSDYVPLILPCKITGLDINQNHHIFAGELNFLNNQSKKYALKVTEDSRFDIEAFDNVDINGTIEIEKNGSLHISSYKTITLENGKFVNSGRIYINSKNDVLLKSDFSIHEGGELVIQ